MDNPIPLLRQEENNARGKTQMKYFPAYAAWLLNNHLADYTRELIRLSREEDIPLLRYFASYSEEELNHLSETSNTHLLTMLAANESDAYISQTTESFISNTIGSVDRDAVIIEDITLVALVRRRVFRFFLKNYTADTILFFNVMEEVDRFTAASEAASFHAYHKIQQEKTREINAELARYQEELLEAQRLAEMGSFFWDLKGGKSTYSPGALEIFGFEDKVTMENFLGNVHPPDLAKINAAINKAFAENGLYECEYSYTVNQREKRIWSRGIVQSEDGKPVSMRGTIRDITKKHLLLRSLQESEDLHNQAQALTHIGNWSWSIADNKILWSDEMYRIYGLEPQSEEITFDRFMSLIHPEDRDRRKQEIDNSLVTGVSQDYFLRIVNPGGLTKMLRGKGEIITNEKNEPIRINGTCQDVTREYQLNRELQEKEQNFRQLIQNAPDAIIVINDQNIITLWNPKTEGIFGWTVDEAVGRSLSETIIPEHSRAAHEQGMKRLLSTGESRILNKTLELTAWNKQQEELYISLTVSETTQGGQKAFIAFLRDITVQKQTQFELAKKTNLLEYKNLELERINQELESFNFVASHDLQEPLRKIQIYSSRIVEKTKTLLDTGVKKDLEKIVTAASRMQLLIQDLLNFSHDTLQRQETEQVNLNELIEEVTSSFLTDVEGRKMRLVKEILPTVKVVRFQFLQLFINMLSNAIKYQHPDRDPIIHISSSVVEGSKTTVKGIFPDKKYLAIQTADNGIGFEAQYAEKIFDLFTRLHSKESYSGTGIGLATCKKIVHNHGGFITAKSEPGKGANFTIYLPEECLVGG
jgi:PAS domain S-box-containing protein